jgi:hypothetical protein
MRPTGRLPRVPGENARPMSALQRLQQQRVTPGPTLQERMKGIGIDTSLERNTLLPFYRTSPYKKGGPFTQGIEMRAPQIAVDMMQGAVLPGHAALGGSYTPEDVTKMALDATPLGRSPASTIRKPTPGEFRKAAPSTEDLARQSGKLYDELDASGVHAGHNSLVETVEKMQAHAIKEGIDFGKDSLTPGSKRISEMLDEIAGTTPNLRWLENTRRHMGAAVDTALRKDNKNDARITMDLMDRLDSYIDNLSGLPAKARALWHKKAKSDTIDRMIEAATHSQSGFENGLRNEANKFMRNKRRTRGFTEAEKKAIDRIANGGSIVAMARMIRHAGLPSGQNNRYLGALLAVYGGHEFGGVTGALGAVGAGTAADRVATAMTRRNAEMARAIAATGGETPVTSGLAERAAPRVVGPAAGAQIQQPPRGPNGGWMIDGEEVF